MISLARAFLGEKLVIGEKQIPVVHPRVISEFELPCQLAQPCPDRPVILRRPLDTRGTIVGHAFT